MSGQSDWFDDKINSRGRPQGPRLKGALFLDKSGHLIFTDTATGKLFQLRVTNGVFKLDEVNIG